MKKTLIALAVAASAVVSGSAMAAGWEQNGSGGSVDLSGTLTPVEKTTPWEVKVGDAVSGLDAQIQKGQKEVSIAVTKAIPVLGIRTQTAEAFQGQAGISPQIDFGGTVSDLNNLADARSAVLTLNVTDESGTKIGSAEAPFIAAGQYSVAGPQANSVYRSMYAVGAQAFSGGLPTVSGAVQEALSNRVAALDSEFAANFSEQGVSRIEKVSGAQRFNNTSHTYSAWYGSGIESNEKIVLTLDNPATQADIIWRASIPVTVTYA
ncbi:hypothetical protein QUQ69_004564 [Escherichia coli]|nr:hypothetical protein [Escherichia coli]ELO4871783.1 hypothetical protein [Escherichia coli]